MSLSLDAVLGHAPLVGVFAAVRVIAVLLCCLCATCRCEEVVQHEEVKKADKRKQICLIRLSAAVFLFDQRYNAS